MTTRIDVLSSNELFRRTLEEPENEDLFKEFEVDGERTQRLHYLSTGDRQTHIVLYAGDRIVAAASLEVNPYETTQLWVLHVSVERGHRQKGYAGKIIEAVYAYALARDKKVAPSSFTKLGQRLKHIFLQYDALHPEAACGQPHKDF